MVISLPWPNPVLSPNARKHHMVKYRAFTTYKNHCLWAMVAQKKALQGKSHFRIVFCPPDVKANGALNRNRRDIDNAIASFKAGQDAIAATTGVDDSKFQVTYAWGEPVKDGCVMVEVVEHLEAA